MYMSQLHVIAAAVRYIPANTCDIICVFQRYPHLFWKLLYTLLLFWAVPLQPLLQPLQEVYCSAALHLHTDSSPLPHHTLWRPATIPSSASPCSAPYIIIFRWLQLS